ncbi:MAG: glycosyl hydrolase family 28 protein [Verrucomicrobiota bacterium]
MPTHVSRIIILFSLVITTVNVYGTNQDVRKHGAAGDGTTLDAAAFQSAIDKASTTGGGVVCVPPGKYLIANVVLKSKVTLHLDKGATLLGSTDRKDYADKSNAVLTAHGAEHIGVEGEGEINGQTTADYSKRAGAPAEPAWRTRLVLIDQCRDVTFRGVTLLNSDSWTLHLRRCEHVRIDGITIRNNYKRLNTDGIDPNSCRDLKITNCHISTGDDAIVLKSTEPFPCEDIEVSHCVLESPTGALKIGTESKGDFRRIRFHDCQIVNSPVGVGIYIKDGATVRDVVAENIEMDLCSPAFRNTVPLYIDIEKRHADSRIGAVHDVTFQNIRITGEAGLLLQGMPESRLENITLRNFKFDVKTPENYARRTKPVGGKRTTSDERDTKYARMPTYAAMANMRNLTIDGLHVNVSEADFERFPRSALALFSVDGARISGVSRIPAAGGPPVVEQTDCQQVQILPGKIKP